MVKLEIELDNETYMKLRKIVLSSDIWESEEDLIISLIKNYIAIVEEESMRRRGWTVTDREVIPGVVPSTEDEEADIMIRLAEAAKELDAQHPYIALLQSRRMSFKRRRR